MSLVDAVRTVALNRAASPALAWRDDTVWSYADLDSAITAVQRALVLRSLAPGARVALLLRNSPHYVALYYGTLAAGCVAVPLNAHERAPVIARQIEHSEASLLVGDHAHPEWGAVRAAIDRLRIGVLALRIAPGPDSLALMLQELADFGPGSDASPTRVSELEEGALASIIYTSGTTGRPKGVMLSHGNLRANAEAVIASLGLTLHDHTLCVLPFSFSYGNSVLHSHLLAGARLTLEDNVAFPQVVLKRMEAAAVSGFAGVPSTFALLLQRHRLTDFNLENLRYVTQAGGPMPRSLLDRLRAQLPSARVFLMYGQTEATARLTCLPPEDIDRKPGSVGKAIAGVEIEVRVGDVPAKAGEVGEVWARGPNVMLGYWKDPEATAETLRSGWLRTGDLGYVDADGYLYIRGRTTEMIKVGAFRVSPGEVEEVLAALGGVDDVGVVGIPDDVLGQTVKAVIVARPECELTEMAIKAFCRERLAAYKVPKVIEFASSLPRTSSGKLQRFKLVVKRAPDRGD